LKKRSFYCAFSLFARLTNYLHQAKSRLRVLLILQLFYDVLMLEMGGEQELLEQSRAESGRCDTVSSPKLQKAHLSHAHTY
jgi:hypothetical protein